MSSHSLDLMSSVVMSKVLFLVLTCLLHMCYATLRLTRKGPCISFNIFDWLCCCLSVLSVVLHHQIATSHTKHNRNPTFNLNRTQHREGSKIWLDRQSTKTQLHLLLACLDVKCLLVRKWEVNIVTVFQNRLHRN